MEPRDPARNGHTCSLTTFSISDMVRCGSSLRRLAESCRTMEEAAEAVVRFLFETLRDRETGEPELALVRLFKTHPLQSLNAALRESVRTQSEKPLDPQTKCLTMLATAGVVPQWNSRAHSAGHQAISLASPEVVARIPMIAAMFRSFGVEVGSLLAADPAFAVNLPKTFQVFHVPDAAGSPCIPAQNEFVIPHGIRSCVGFGGMLRHGSLYAIILFSKAAIDAPTASKFQTLSVSLRSALLPLDEEVFIP